MGHKSLTKRVLACRESTDAGTRLGNEIKREKARLFLPGNHQELNSLLTAEAWLNKILPVESWNQKGE
jgi:hypothetical protein